MSRSPQAANASNNQDPPLRGNWRQGFVEESASAPAIGTVSDEDAYLDYYAERTEDGVAELSANAGMWHSNRSVPALPSHGSPIQHTEPVPPVPTTYDPTAALDQFHALRITEPVARGPSAMSYQSDPIPRAGTSMSTQSYAAGQQYHPQHANTIPHTGYDPRQYGYQSADPSANEQHIPYSEASGSQAYNGSWETDGASLYSPEAGQSSAAHTGYAQSTHSWHGQGAYDYGTQGSGSQYYPAQSDTLHAGGPSVPYADSGYSGSQSSYSLTSAYSAPSGGDVYGGPPQPNSGGYAQSVYGASSASHYQTSPNIDAPRPAYNRTGTSASVTLRTQKTKVVDLSSPPYTKQFVDEYRQRIKADPDPEAHFMYAKYLIDAAKKIGADAKDQRAVRKYRDLLITESLKVIRRLATQGDAYADAQFFLANCHGTGMLGLQVEHERAYHLYLQAAKQNHPGACYRVAVCNEIGVGTKRDLSRAAAFYRKSASLGDTAAMYKLGMVLLSGQLGEQRNPREAIGWLRRAAEQADEENPHALHELGRLHEMPNSGVVLHDPKYAKELYTKAAQLGYVQAQFKLAQCYEYGALTCPVDPRRSIAWYTKAAEKGDAEAELSLSGWYLTGSEGVLKQSDSEAYLWARRAANKGLSKAEYAVGYYAEVGIGVKQDLDFAKRWYMRAAAQGNKRAMTRLTELKRMGNRRANMARPTRQEAKDECVIC